MKLLWTSFPVKCVSFALANFVHATEESTHMESLRLHILPKRKFDPNKVAYNVTTGVKRKPYNHEDNYFEDLLHSVVSFEQEFKWVMENLKHGDFQRFQEFKNERLQVIPMHLLKLEDKSTSSVTIDSGGPSSQVDSQVNTKKTPNTGKPQDADNMVESSRKSIEKQVMSTSNTEISSEAKGGSLEQEWGQFNQKLQGTPKASNTQETEEYKTPMHVHKDTEPQSIGEQSTPIEEQEKTS